MSNPAPGALETVRAFVNTYDADEATEDLARPADLAAWLAGHELLGTVRSRATTSAADLAAAIELREALRAHLRAHHGEPLPPAATEVLDAAARRARLQIRFTAGEGTALEPQAGGIDGALGRLLAIVKAAMDDDTWPRLKVCPADDCQWAFYDVSRNRSAVWCDMAVCGNRQKVRAFRTRRDASAPSSAS